MIALPTRVNLEVLVLMKCMPTRVHAYHPVLVSVLTIHFLLKIQLNYLLILCYITLIHMYYKISQNPISGINCESSICTTDPCEAGGTCKETDSGYSCECLMGRTGSKCETEVNPCFSDPCVNGMCNAQGPVFTCDCIPGYSGESK